MGIIKYFKFNPLSKSTMSDLDTFKTTEPQVDYQRQKILKVVNIVSFILLMVFNALAPKISGNSF